MMVCPTHAAQVAPPSGSNMCDVCAILKKAWEQGARAERAATVKYLREKWAEPEIASAIDSGKHCA